MKRLSLHPIIIILGAIFLLPGNLAYAGKTRKINISELRSKIEAAWIGQMIGNIYGLPHENKYIAEPGTENWPYGYSKNLDKLKKYNGAFSDDDTDVEYMYLLQMQKYGPEPTYEQLRNAWLYHIRDRVWLANRGALGLMHFGYTPPYTGNKDLNPHWYQIDPQLINEVWAITAPGMVDYAAAKSGWAARITSDDWGVEPTIHYGAMYAAAFFEKDIRKLIETGLAELPPEGRYAATVRDMIAIFEKHPDDWKSARQEMAKKYYTDEPDMTKTIWNANLNGACAILALLYGNGDFQLTLDLACAMGFDADNQAATLGGLLGVIHGMEGLPEELFLPVEGWTMPFNDTYVNITRYDLPDAKISEMAEMLLKSTIDLIKLKGGSVSGKPGSEVLSININAAFNPPLEFGVGPLPRLEKGMPANHAFYNPANSMYNWTLVSGALPDGLEFSDGKLSGVPLTPGYFDIVLQLDNGDQKITRTFQLLVRGTNIAPSADTILANVRMLNEIVLDSCWYTFGKSMYAKDISVINDGILIGPGSVFYSLAAKAKIPKVDYYGYGWDEPQKISMLALHLGGMEEFGGWFTSLNVQYLDQDGKWQPVTPIKMEPDMPFSDPVFYQPHFVEYIITFPTVETKAIRVIGDTKIQDHWNRYTKNVSGFTSVTELSVYP